MGALLAAHDVPAAVAAAAAARLLVAPRRHPGRVRRLSTGGDRDERALVHRFRVPLSALAFVGAWVFVGSTPGVVAGLLAAVAAWRVLSRAESPALRRRRTEYERDLPTTVHLLAWCLEAGSATSGALDAVASAMPGAVAEELVLVRHRLALGLDPVTVWRGLAAHPELRPLGRAMARAHESGASVTGAVGRLAVDLEAQARARADARARSVEVRAAAPLGVCFLPAFLLLGVVPLVVGVFSSMHLFG